jgi:hypothetical protein
MQSPSRSSYSKSSLRSQSRQQSQSSHPSLQNAGNKATSQREEEGMARRRRQAWEERRRAYASAVEEVQLAKEEQ